MQTPTHQVMLSLMEPALYLVDAMRQHSVPVLQISDRTRPITNTEQLNAVLNYNPVPILEAFCSVIFSPYSDPDHRVDYDLSGPTQRIVKDGLHPHFAAHIVQTVFNQCLDVVASVLPNLVFTDELEVQHGICNGFDLLITISERTKPEAGMTYEEERAVFDRRQEEEENIRNYFLTAPGVRKVL